MGYTTDFVGQFDLNKPLDDETYKFLISFNETMRMARSVGKEHGEEGEFYVEGDGFRIEQDKTIIDSNRPPKTQPSLWCQWRPSKDRRHIIWDGGEKFHYYIEWTIYLSEKILLPKGYKISGRWNGRVRTQTTVE